MPRAKRARQLGFSYMPAAEVATQPLAEILARIEALAARDVADDPATRGAVLGKEPVPVVLLSQLFDQYETLTGAARQDLSPDQLRKWANPKKRALANLLKVVRDKPVTELTRNDALDFRVWWQERVLVAGIEIATANKDVGHINRMLRQIERSHRLGMGPVFAELRLEGETQGQRVAFAPEWVQTRILAEGALDALNPEARRILYIMAETGMRLSEICNLTAETIRLDHQVPHVVVRADGRRMKTKQSARELPLVGLALMAAQAQPEGFPPYRDKAASLSAITNNVMRSAGLLPLEGQSAYSFRHCFEDRLTAVEAPEKLIAAMMGHKYQRPRYGAGPSLAQKQEWLQRIAFTPPSSV
ncbi:site-specific integrase [Methylobacterium nodulans]|uniref:Integrase family protein n=1 Tax=Methylobacterium nodulans (strain LMG 21967 / CNCM I-2342 / ORS 2060) TaxID=460265 RepID=B8IGA1_METNO|nr:site-specific integrase [Methylobacterium nodulans]ACL61578.1 integrase family protein [Methylobacterium nodulans ORS 2060]